MSLANPPPPSPPPPPQAALAPSLVPLYVIAAVLDAGFGSIFAVLAEIKNQFGLETFWIGVIGGAGFVSSFAAQISLARYADRGHARLLIRLGLAVAVLSMLVLGFADSLSDFVFGRFLFGLSEGMVLPAARRIAIAANPARAGESLGRLMSFQVSGFLVGPLVGSVLFNLWGGVEGVRATFFFTLFAVLACAPLVARMRVEEASEDAARQRGVIRELLRERSMWGMLVAAAGYYGAFGIYEAIWAVFLDDLGASQVFIGVTLTIFAVPMMVLAPAAGRLAERHGPMRVALLAILVTIPSVALYGAFENLWLLTSLMVVQAVGDAVVMPASQLAISKYSGDHQAAGQGLLSAVGLAVAAIVAIASGAVYENSGAGVLFGGWALVMGFTVLAAARLGREDMRAPAVGATPETR
ncbi:MAG: MFS transporter [Myxococcota bacterium]